MTARSFASIHTATWWLTAVVAWGVWNAMTDCFPLNENQARPSWYIYGWPVCFATSGRGRLNFYLGFDAAALIFDLTIAAVFIACTVFTDESISRGLPQIRIIDILAITAGISLMVFVLGGGLQSPFELLLGAVPPAPNRSAVTGDVRITSRLPIPVTFPLACGLVAVGFAIVKVPFVCSHRR